MLSPIKIAILGIKDVYPNLCCNGAFIVMKRGRMLYLNSEEYSRDNFFEYPLLGKNFVVIVIRPYVPFIVIFRCR